MLGSNGGLQRVGASAGAKSFGHERERFGNLSVVPTTAILILQ